MRRSKDFLRTRDIPWAIKIGDYYCSFFSAGDDIPESIEDQLFIIWSEIKKFKVVFNVEEVALNEEYLDMKFPFNKYENKEELAFYKKWYTHSFIAMARRGFYAFDRDINSPITKSSYYLIASPPRLIERITDNLLHLSCSISPKELDGMNIVDFVNKHNQHNQQYEKDLGLF